MVDWSATAYLICYVVIFIFTWILNILLTVGIYRSRQLFLCRKKRKTASHKDSSRIEFAQLANYYFITSICLSNVISVCFNPPSSIMLNWFYIRKTKIASFLCLIHSSLNTYLCNLAFLHVLCSSLDTFLRVRNPRLYIASQRSKTTFLKVSAPWIVTFIQSACQFTINNKKAVIIKNSLCLLNDGNFLILRSVISYALPLIICVILIILQIVYLRFLTSINVRNLQYLIESYSYGKQHQTKIDANQTGQVDEGLQSFPTAHGRNENILQNEEFDPNSSKMTNLQESSRILKHNCPKHGLISFPLSFGERAVTSYLTYSYNNKENVENTLNKSVSFSMPDVTNLKKLPKNHFETKSNLLENGISVHKKMWLKMYKVEQLSLALNMVMCIISIGIWSPLMLSTLAYKLCEDSPCTIHILIDRIHDFEWWAFAGGLLFPCSFILIDSTIRKALRLYCL